MHPDTVATLTQIFSKQLFRNVGNYNSIKCIKVNNWDEALHSCTTIEWRNLTLEARNQISGGLFPQYQHILNQWNDRADEHEDFIAGPLERQFENIDLSPEQKKTLFSRTRWDLHSL